MNSRYPLVTMTACILAAGCVGTDVGNPETPPAQLEFVVPDYETMTQALMIEGWTIRTFDVYVEGLSTVAAGGANPEIALIDSPTKIDLLADSQMLEFETDATEAEQLTVRFARESAPWLEVELVDAAGRVVSIEATNPDRIRYKGEIPLNQGILFSAHPVLPWLSEEADSLAALSDDALISESNEPQLLQSFLRAFAPNANLYLDRDKNKKLDVTDKKVGVPAR